MLHLQLLNLRLPCLLRKLSISDHGDFHFEIMAAFRIANGDPSRRLVAVSTHPRCPHRFLRTSTRLDFELILKNSMLVLLGNENFLGDPRGPLSKISYRGHCHVTAF